MRWESLGISELSHPAVNKLLPRVGSLWAATAKGPPCQVGREYSHQCGSGLWGGGKVGLKSQLEQVLMMLLPTVSTSATKHSPLSHCILEPALRTYRSIHKKKAGSEKVTHRLRS